MNLSELRQAVMYIVQYNTGQVDQSYAGTNNNAYYQIDRAINEAIREIVRTASRTVSVQPFLCRYSFTWEADAETYELPAHMVGTTIYGVQTVSTDGSPNETIPLQQAMALGSGMYRYDGKHWGWFPVPTTDKSLVAIYVAKPQTLQQPDDVPDLIPDTDHDLIVWSAAVILAQIADEDHIPQMWVNRRDELRRQYHKQVGLAVPLARSGPGVLHYE